VEKQISSRKAQECKPVLPAFLFPDLSSLGRVFLFEHHGRKRRVCSTVNHVNALSRAFVSVTTQSPGLEWNSRDNTASAKIRMVLTHSNRVTHK
jgi:hypothetical protein